VRLRTWLKQDPKKAIRLIRRVVEGLREVGVLLIAFAPLEAGLSEAPLSASVKFLSVFLCGGFGLFGLALLLEWRLGDVE
jgi:hypothetical protein